MAIQAIVGGFWMPEGYTVSFDPSPQTNGFQISGAGAQVAMILLVPKTGSLHKIVWGTRIVTANNTIDVRVETVDATTGNPSGTLWGTTTNGAQALITGTDNNKVWATALTADAAVTQGDRIAVVFVNGSAGTTQLTSFGVPASPERNIYLTTFFSGSWSKLSNQAPWVALEYADGSYAPLITANPPGVGTISTLSTSSTPDVMGLRFRLPVPVRVAGAWLVANLSGDCAIRLVSTAYHQVNQTGVLASVLLDKDVRSTASEGSHRVRFAAPVTLAAATDYRLLLEPTTSTTLTFYDYGMQSLVQLDAWPGGRDWHLTSAKDPTADGSWTNYNSGTFRRPFMGLLVDGLDDGTGGGGGSSEHAHTFVGVLA